MNSFNPLAGIRCFLTSTIDTCHQLSVGRFQSPCGDSLFSDCLNSRGFGVTWWQRFQSPCGDSLFSDPQILWVTDEK